MTPFYESAGIQIYHGDNCEVMGSLPKESVDLVVTSPPYDDLRTYGGHSWDFYGVAWNLKRILKPGGVIVWVVNDETKDGSESGTSLHQAIHFRNIGLNLHDTMIYSKPNFSAVGALQTRYAPVFEYMFVFSKGGISTFNPIKDRKALTSGKKKAGTIRQRDGTMKRMSNEGWEQPEYGQRYNIWEYSPETQPGHPAPFPESLAKDHIASWSNPGDVVLDCFLGSGTTLKAAKELGRKGIGIEVDSKYIQIAKKRLQQEYLPLLSNEQPAPAVQEVGLL